MANERFAQVVLLAASGLARDDVVNGFAFGGTADSAHDATEIGGALEDFYNGTDGSGNRISQYMSGWLDRGANRALIKVYDVSGHLDGSPHGSPYAVIPFTLGAQIGGSHNMPEQVAVAASFRADFGTALEFGAPTGVGTGRRRPRSSLRGRVYLGPWHNGALGAEDSSGHSVIYSGLVNCISFHMTALKTNTPADGIPWSVWSRKTSSMHQVVSVDVDPRFDVQRRRATKQGLLVFP